MYHWREKKNDIRVLRYIVEWLQGCCDDIGNCQEYEEKLKIARDVGHQAYRITRIIKDR